MGKYILIAPDKFKGTISARRASDIIARACGDIAYVTAPMADGGEGTAAALCRGSEWERRDDYYVNKRTKVAVIDSHDVIGSPASDLLRASSAPLGLKVREIIQGGCKKVVIGVGGTATCDGGEGFLYGLGIEKYAAYRDMLVGLCDVCVPLLPKSGMDDLHLMKSEPSALMFAAQKGALDIDYPVLYRRLEAVRDKYSQGRSSQFDGAGGGLGFALASAIGAQCYQGAPYVLEHYDIKWDSIGMVITGEGCIDKQTCRGKVVAAVSDAAAARGIPCVAIGGAVKDASGLTCECVAADAEFGDEPLSAEVAEKRLYAAAKKVLLSSGWLSP